MQSSQSSLALLLLLVWFHPAAVAVSPGPCHHDSLFPSELDAVVAAMNTYNPISIREDREYMGAILQAGENFRCSVIAGGRGRDTIRIAVVSSDWHDITAFWHTHGDARSTNRYFSNRDTELVNRYRKPLYLGDYTGYLKKFLPGDKRISRPMARRLGLPPQRGAAFGTLVRDPNHRIVKIHTRSNHIAWHG